MTGAEDWNNGLARAGVARVGITTVRADRAVGSLQRAGPVRRVEHEFTITCPGCGMGARSWRARHGVSAGSGQRPSALRAA